MKVAALLLSCLFLASCSDKGNADAAPIVLDDEDGAPGGTPDADVNNPPPPPDANTGGVSACDMGSCQQCQECSMMTPQGMCMDEYNTCGGNQECVDFANCLQPCMDQACVDNCVMMYPNGADLYIALASCVICDDCYTVCDGAGAGCQ